MFKIIELKTEYQHNPIGIGCHKPIFTWQICSEQPSEQVSYRLLVASSLPTIETGVGDLMDSGKVISKSLIAQYSGSELRSGQICYVKVISYTNDGFAASDIATFEMGLLEQSDWKGNWMSMPVNNQGGTSLYRKVIDVESKPIARARAYVCGLGYHESFINGIKLGDSVLNPGVTDYSKRNLYCTYDITALLVAGKNVFGIELGHGWMGNKKALAQVNITYEDGTTQQYHSSTNGGWWVSGSPTIDNSIYGGEVYDARLEDKWPKNWATTDFEPAWDNGWMFTIYAAPEQGKLEPQTMEEIKVCDELPAISLNQIESKILIADFGVNISGWAKIKVKGERGARVTIKYGERLAADGYVNRLNLRSAESRDIYILSGKGEQQYSPRFTYHGFQYAQIEIIGECELISITAQHVHTATENVGAFDCSDEQLNRLHKNAVVTEYNNQHSILTDCPQRDERFGWLNDLGSRLYQTVYNCDMARFFAKFTKDITDTQLSNGAIGDTAPYFTGGRPADPVCIAYLLMPLYNYRLYGDKRLLKEEYVGLKKWVDFLISMSENYIMTYSYYADWVAPTCFNEHTDNIYVSTLYLYWHCTELSKIAKIAGKNEDSKRYTFIADKTKEAINKKYFNKQTCNYESGTQAANAIALSLGIPEQSYRSKVAKNINDDVVNKGYHSSCGNVGYRHMLYMLCEYGYTDTALKILKNPEYPGWGFMLANGATSVWERWESEMSNEMDSFNHPMFGSYDAIFYSFLGGINVCDDAVASDKICICPHTPAQLSYVNCSYKTVKGVVVSNWKRVDNKVEYEICVPHGTCASVCIEGRDYNLGGGKYFFDNGILKL